MTDSPHRDRRAEAFRIREHAARYERDLPYSRNVDNGDEERYPEKFANFSKGLPHNDLGEPDRPAYDALLRAVRSSDPDAYDAIPLGGELKLANPQAAVVFELEGPDSHHLEIRPAPAFASTEAAAEVAEIYWQALTRDVPFSRYDTDPVIADAAADLSGFSDFRGPKENGQVTPGTLFRGNTDGDLAGPYLSQFLWKPIPYGTRTIEQKIRTTVPRDDHLTDPDAWLAVQKGGPAGTNQFDPEPRYIRSGRDLGEFVHRDFVYQSYLDACLILLELSAPLDPAVPYLDSKTQGGFVTFGAAHVLDRVSRAANLALKAGWYQKWNVHRRVRPEVFAGRVHHHKIGAKAYPIHRELLDSPVLDRVHDYNDNQSYLLPIAYPEGSPAHPAYPAGHACVAGACVTVLKAFFDESFVVPDAVVATEDGTDLVPYNGQLTVGGELNKLAANISLGRDTAGMHYRSDGIEGLNLGEEAAIRFLKEETLLYNENFDGFRLTKFDGKKITISPLR